MGAFFRESMDNLNALSTKSVWEHAKASGFSAVQKNLKADVCIVGSGITGITTAYLLAKAGKRVVVVDKGDTANGETAFTTAHLSTILDKRFFELEKLHGKENTELVLKSHFAAIDFIESACEKEKIHCDFERVNGYLFFEGKDGETVDRELEAVKKLGYEDAEKLEHGPHGANLGHCLKFPRQAQFHPLRYLEGLIEVILAEGGTIYENSLVQDIHEKNDGVQIQLENGHSIQADAAVIATNVPFNDRYNIHMKQAPYRTYVIAGEIPKHAVPKNLYWDTQNPYHYIRLFHPQGEKSAEHDLLIVGGEDHKTGQEADCEKSYENLLHWTQKKFPMMKNVHYKWSGQVIESIDGLAYIGLNHGKKKIYIGTAYSGNGMTYGTIAAMMFADLILGKKNPYSKLYDPCRKNIKALGSFMEDGMNVAGQWAGGLAPRHGMAMEDLPKGSGTVIQEGLKKIAVYKDAKGTICKFSAVCPHLGCIVKWNNAEASWDCPCHGSRFNTEGKVMNGPAKENLRPADR